MWIDFFLLRVILPQPWEGSMVKFWGWNLHKHKSYGVKNFKISSKNPEIQNLLLMHLPIYNKNFFSGWSDEKNFFLPLGPHGAGLGAKNFFCRITLKKKFYYILVNALMANFEFRDFRTKFWNFLRHNFCVYGSPSLKFWPYYLLMVVAKWHEGENNLSYQEKVSS